MMNTRFDIVTVEIFTSYSNKHYWAGYWILALYKYIIIIIIPMWGHKATMLVPPFTVLSDHFNFPHSQTHIGQFGYNISSPM